MSQGPAVDEPPADQKVEDDIDMKRALLKSLVIASALALALSACGGDDDDSTAGSTSSPTGAGGIDYGSLSGDLKASGATFPDAFYQAVIEKFADVAPNLNVTYNAVGSGTGKEEFGQGITDFAGSDSLVKEGDGPTAGSFLYVPTVAAPITISYNLSDVSELKLSPETVAGIFQRDIKKWNDPKIAADNSGVTLPSTAITVAHRSDGSGTTNNFTKYLDAASNGVWKLGTGDEVAWPADTQGGEKNAGVAQLVKQTKGAIGYVDLSDAKESGLTFASIKNKDGSFVGPTLDGAQAALAGAEVKDDLTYNPLNAPGAGVYPITAPTYILVRTKYDDTNKGKAVKGFVTYVLTDGQALAEGVNFSGLPDSLKQKALAQLDKIEGAG
jgi:phosphate transport system substrate-binding protein